MFRFRILILPLFILHSFSLCAQKTATIYDSDLVYYKKDILNNDLDSVVWIRDENRYSILWNVYFDKEKKYLAYSSIAYLDSCVMYDFWRNGSLKKKNEYKKSNGIYVLYYEELYCKNGQLIEKEYPNKPEKQHIINYYCSGQKKNEFTQMGLGVDGPMVWWFENGNKKYDFFYKNSIKEGEWRYYSEDGKLNKTEKYKNGNLINEAKK
jgi:antitoxin component YwqK of YwqJK toxin-antitoxin module